MNKTITPNEYRQELRQRLLRIAMREFRSKGIKGVSRKTQLHPSLSCT